MLLHKEYKDEKIYLNTIFLNKSQYLDVTLSFLNEKKDISISLYKLGQFVVE